MCPPHREANMAPTIAVVKVILVVGALLRISKVLQRSSVQQAVLIVYSNPRKYPTKYRSHCAFLARQLYLMKKLEKRVKSVKK